MRYSAGVLPIAVEIGASIGELGKSPGRNLVGGRRVCEGPKFRRSQLHMYYIYVERARGVRGGVSRECRPSAKRREKSFNTAGR